MPDLSICIYWKDLEEDEERRQQEEAETYDPEAIERKRKRQIDEWKEEHLRSGLAQENANFLVSFPAHGSTVAWELSFLWMLPSPFIPSTLIHSP